MEEKEPNARDERGHGAVGGGARRSRCVSCLSPSTAPMRRRLTTEDGWYSGNVSHRLQRRLKSPNLGQYIPLPGTKQQLRARTVIKHVRVLRAAYDRATPFHIERQPHMFPTSPRTLSVATTRERTECALRRV